MPGSFMSFAMFSLKTISDVWGLCALGPMHWLHPFTCNRLQDYPRHKNSLWLVVICWKSAIVFHLIGALPPQLASECVVGGRELIVRRWFAPKKLPSQRSKTSQCLIFLPQSVIFAEIKKESTVRNVWIEEKGKIGLVSQKHLNRRPREYICRQVWRRQACWTAPPWVPWTQQRLGNLTKQTINVLTFSVHLANRSF